MDIQPKTDAVLTKGEPSTIETNSQIAEIRAAASVLIERIQYMRSHGITFSGMRDLYEVLGYDRQITPTQYRDRYRRGGIAGRVIDTPCNATWRGGIELVEDEDPKVSTEFEKAVEELNKRLKIWSTLWRADKLAQQGEYAVILIGALGNFDEPLRKGKPEQLLYLTPFSQEDAIVQEWDTDYQSPRFGLPTKYQLRRYADSLERTIVTQSGRAPAFVSPELNKPVHWTRVHHIPAEGILDNEVFGPPALERIWNLLDDLDKVTGGGAEAFWLRANQGIQLDIDKDMTLNDTEKAALKEQADQYSNQIRRMLTTRGVDAKTLGSDVANFSNPADAILTQIAGAKAIPKRILTGSEMGELASSQDRDNWKDQVDGRQTQYADPYCVRPFFDRLIEYGYLPTPAQYNTQWAHMQVLTETEKSEGAAKWASINQTNGTPVFLNAEIRDKWYGMPPLTDAEIQKENERKQLGKPEPPPQLQQQPGQPVPPKDEEEKNTPPARARAAQVSIKKALQEEDLAQLMHSLGVLSPDDMKILKSLRTALDASDTDTISRLLGLEKKEVPTSVEVINPPKRLLRKSVKYSMVEGVMRPTDIIEEEV